MALISASIPGFFNGVSQQAPANRRANQGELQKNALGTLVDGLIKRPGTEHLSVLTSNAATGCFVHTINRDTTERYIVILTGEHAEPIEVFTLSGVKCTVQYGDLDASLNFTADTKVKDYVIPGVIWSDWMQEDNASDWSVTDCTVAFSTDHYAVTYVAATQHCYQTLAFTAGEEYTVTFEIKDGTSSGVSGSCGVYDGHGHINTDGYVNFTTTSNWTEYTFTFTSTTGYDHFCFYTEMTGAGNYKLKNVRIERTSHKQDSVSEQFKSITVADHTFIVNNMWTVSVTSDVNGDSLTGTVQTFSDLPGSPSSGNVYKITGDDISGFDDWYVKYDGTVWHETIKPGASLGRFNDHTMPHRLVRTGTNAFTLAPNLWEDRAMGDTTSAPTPSFAGYKISNVFFYKNRLGLLSDDNVIMSRTGDYFNFYPETALDVLDTDPIDVSATSKQVEILRSVATFDKTLILLADQQQFDFGSGEENLTPTTVAITPTTRFTICQLCEPITAGPNVYFVAQKTDFAAIREYFIQPDSLLNDAADITAHVPRYIPMGYISLEACNSLDILFAHSDSDPDALYVYKYFWSGEDKAQSSWSQWTFGGDIMGMGIIDTILYLVVKYDQDTCLERIQLETVTTGDLDFRVHLDRMKDITGSYSSGNTTFTLPYDIRDVIVVGSDLITNGGFDTDTVWTKGTGWTIADGVASCDGSQSTYSQIYQTAVESGKTYVVTYTISNRTAGTIAPRIGGSNGAFQSANGTYSELITSGGTTAGLYANADFVGDIDNVIVYEVDLTATNPFQLIDPVTGRPLLGVTVSDLNKMTISGDYSTKTYHIGRKYEMRYRLSPWYLRDKNNVPKLAGRLQVRSLTLNFKDTDYFKVEVTPQGRDTYSQQVWTSEFTGAIIGVSGIGEVTHHTGEKRFMVMGRNTLTQVDIVSDSYLPCAFQTGSWEGIYYPRSKEK